MIRSRLTIRDRLRIVALRKIAGEHAVLINCRFQGGLHVEPQNPVQGQLLIVDCRFLGDRPEFQNPEYLEER